MKTSSLLIAVICAGVLSACAATIPMELADARAEYGRASSGPTAQAAPAELHVANLALARGGAILQNRSRLVSNARPRLCRPAQGTAS